ncbi:hypothetical protein RFI_21927, partial [Reticulomyxa filosa]
GLTKEKQNTKTTQHRTKALFSESTPFFPLFYSLIFIRIALQKNCYTKMLPYKAFCLKKSNSKNEGEHLNYLEKLSFVKVCFAFLWLIPVFVIFCCNRHCLKLYLFFLFIYLLSAQQTPTKKKKMSSDEKVAKEATTWHKITECVNIIDAIAEGEKSNGCGFTVDARTVWKKSAMSNAKSNGKLTSYVKVPASANAILKSYVNIDFPGNDIKSAKISLDDAVLSQKIKNRFI